jgi:hypothetical protein
MAARRRHAPLDQRQSLEGFIGRPVIHEYRGLKELAYSYELVDIDPAGLFVAGDHYDHRLGLPEPQLVSSTRHGTRQPLSPLPGTKMIRGAESRHRLNTP